MEFSDPRIQPVTMPKWGLSMKVGQVVDWIVAEGDVVALGDDLADIETEKIAGTLESSAQGVVRRILARPHQAVPVSGVIAIVAPADVDEAAIEAAATQAGSELAELAAAAASGEDEAGPVLATVSSGPHTVSYAGVGATGEQASAEHTVVLVHGYGGDRASWLFVQEPLATAGEPGSRAVYALDLPGHGASSKTLTEGATLGELAASVLAVLDAVAPPGARVHLVGHSLGGAVAAEAAVRRPHRVASLTLIAPAGLGSGRAGAADGVDAGYLRGFAAASSRRELKPLLERLFADASLVTRQLVDDVLKYKRLDGVGPCLASALGILLTEHDGQAINTAVRLRAIEGHGIPVTVLWGAADAILAVPPPPARASECDPAIDVTVIEGAGHMLHMEAPQAVLGVIESRLRSG